MKEIMRAKNNQNRNQLKDNVFQAYKEVKRPNIHQLTSRRLQVSYKINQLVKLSY